MARRFIDRSIAFENDVGAGPLGGTGPRLTYVTT